MARNKLLLEVGLLEVGLLEVGLLEVGLLEVGLLEVGLYYPHIGLTPGSLFGVIELSLPTNFWVFIL